MTTDSKQLNALIPADLDKELALFCAANGIKRKEAVELALRNLLSKQADRVDR